MKVKDLIAQLQKFDGDMEVLGTDNEGWFFDYSHARKVRIFEGQETDDKKVDWCVGLT